MKTHKQWLDEYEEKFEVDEKYRCPKCETDKYVTFDLYHTEDDVPYDGASCENCGTMVWTEDIY